MFPRTCVIGGYTVAGACATKRAERKSNGGLKGRNGDDGIPTVLPPGAGTSVCQGLRGGSSRSVATSAPGGEALGENRREITYRVARPGLVCLQRHQRYLTTAPFEGGPLGVILNNTLY